MGNVLAAHMKNTGENADYNWNNKTLLGETIEKALLKNTPAYKKYEKDYLKKSNPTDYNSVLIKRACCLGIPYNDKKSESSLPVINVPIANIGYNSKNKLVSGLPDADGKFTRVQDETSLFDNLPTKDKKYNKYFIAPRNSTWSETQPVNEDRKSTFNSGGMIIKKLQFKNNKGEKLINEEQCTMTRESWESVTENKPQKYESYSKTGTQGRVYDVETTTDVCDAFYQYYGKNQIVNRQCIVPDPDNPDNDIIDPNQPGCSTGVPDDDGTMQNYFYTDKGQSLTFTPQYHYPNDLACINSPYGSVYTDKGGKNPYRAGSVYPVDYSLANPIGIDMRCSGNINEPVNWGEAYTTTNYRKEGNSTKCVNALVLNNIKADNVEVSDINQTNDCDTVDAPPQEPDEEDEEESELQNDETENTDAIVENEKAQLKAEADENSRKIATENAIYEKEEAEKKTAKQQEEPNFLEMILENEMYLYGGIGFFVLCCFIFIIIVMRR